MCNFSSKKNHTNQHAHACNQKFIKDFNRAEKPLTQVFTTSKLIESLSPTKETIRNCFTTKEHAENFIPMVNPSYECISTIVERLPIFFQLL